MVSHPSSRRGFSRVDEQRPQPASTHPGRLPRQPSLGKGAEGGERKFPYGVEVRERGWAPRFLREAWGHQEQAVKESARLGAGFPDPRALRIPLVSKFPPSSASTGSRPTPSSACQRHWWLRREAQSQGSIGRKEWPERVYEDPALPAHCALYQAATAGGASTPRPAPRKLALGALRLPKPRTWDTTPSSLRAAGHRHRNLDGGEQMSCGN